MIIINTFGIDASPSSPAVIRNGSAASTRASTSSWEDTVEFSPAARALARGLEESSFRTARLRAIRAEIAAGTYETQARIEGTVARLLDVLA